MRRYVRYPRKLFTIMVLCFVGFNSFLLLVTGVVLYSTYSGLAYREILTAKKQLLDETSRKLSNYITGVQDTARFLVTHDMVHQSLADPPSSVYDYVTKSRDLSEEFQKLATVKEGVHSIELYTDWLVGYPSFLQELHPMEDAERQGWYARTAASDGFWLASHDYPVRGGQIRMLSYVHRIIGIRGETLGIVRINVLEDRLFDMLHEDGADRDENYYIVVDAAGNFIASALPEDLPALLETEDIEGQLEDSRYSVIRSERNAQSWMIMQLLSKDVLMQSGKELRLLIIALLGTIIVLSVPLAFWLSKKLTSPIYGIVEGMNAIERGQFNVRVHTSTIHEYLYLTTHFNRMVQRLKDLIGRLNQEHRDRRTAEMQLLHAQIKPHFLYNTLDLIHWRALDHNAHEISRMVHQLSKLFRIGLGNNKWYASVRDELDHARCYMAIQEYRQNFAIDYRQDVESDLFDCLVPKIIIQPFLENAVIHGFRHWRGTAEIRVGVYRSSGPAGDERLIVEVTDNGHGLPEGFDASKLTGIGIRNVDDRIQLYCGPKYGIRIGRGGQGGTQVVITLPLVRQEDELDQLTRSMLHEYDSVSG